jgi:hypothetical protein
MTTRERDFHGVMIPSATTARSFSCGLPDCRHAHIVGFDEEGQPFCEIVLNESMLLKALDIANDVQQELQNKPCLRVVE